MKEEDLIADLLVALNQTITKTQANVDPKMKANVIFRATLHLLSQQIALGIVQNETSSVSVDQNAIFSGLAVKIRSIADNYVKIMKEARDVKADDQRH